jgi:phosphohistidine phosphatase
VLFLLHHADAVDALTDSQRPLSRAGRAHAEQLAVRARARGVKPDAIWHSGKLRARQTAEPLWRACNPLAEFAAVRGLQPDDPPRWIKDIIDQDPRHIVLAGHMPHLARLYRSLVGDESDQARIEFPQHGLVALERRGELWREVWREE